MTAAPYIKVLVLDVDGVLTDGKIALAGQPHDETKYFHVHEDFTQSSFPEEMRNA